MSRPRLIPRLVHAGVRVAPALVLILALLLGGLRPTLTVHAGGTTTISASGDTGVLGKVGSSDYRCAQTFQVYAGRLTSFSFTLSGVSGSPGSVTWSINPDSGGSPGTALATDSMTPSTPGTNTVTLGASGPLLSAETTYWLVLSAPSAPDSAYYLTQVSAVSVYDQGAYAVSTNGGAWSPRSADMDSSFTTTDDTPTPSNTPTETYTPTGTLTVTPVTYTPTPSSTNTLVPTWTWTPTPNLYVITTLTTGQEVAVKYEITGGDVLIGSLLIILVTLMMFMLFMEMLHRRQA